MHAQRSRTLLCCLLILKRLYHCYLHPKLQKRSHDWHVPARNRTRASTVRGEHSRKRQYKYECYKRLTNAVCTAESCLDCLKGQCHEIFCFWFFLEPVSPKSLIILLGPFRIFSKIRGDIRSSRFATDVNDTGGKWKKPSSRKILIILFGHLWVVELTYIQYKFLTSSSL